MKKVTSSSRFKVELAADGFLYIGTCAFIISRQELNGFTGLVTFSDNGGRNTSTREHGPTKRKLRIYDDRPRCIWQWFACERV